MIGVSGGNEHYAGTIFIANNGCSSATIIGSNVEVTYVSNGVVIVSCEKYAIIFDCILSIFVKIMHLLWSHFAILEVLFTNQLNGKRKVIKKLLTIFPKYLCHNTSKQRRF